MSGLISIPLLGWYIDKQYPVNTFIVLPISSLLTGICFGSLYGCIYHDDVVPVQVCMALFGVIHFCLQAPLSLFAGVLSLKMADEVKMKENKPAAFISGVVNGFGYMGPVIVFLGPVMYKLLGWSPKKDPYWIGFMGIFGMVVSVLSCAVGYRFWRDNKKILATRQLGELSSFQKENRIQDCSHRSVSFS